MRIPTMFALIFAVSLVLLLGESRSQEKQLDRETMSTSFGGVNAGCCEFNPGCLFPGSYTQTCASLPLDYCNGSSITQPTGLNNKRCTATGIAGDLCEDTSLNPQVDCASCFTCVLFVDLLMGNSCMTFMSCGGPAMNPSACTNKAGCY